jgi:Holliday junction DNA helicase RuvB
LINAKEEIKKQDILDEDVTNIRPQTLSSYIGQGKIKQIVSVSIRAAKERNESLEHMLFYGPPGLGKTTLASIIANEMGKQIKITTGPAIERPGDLVATLCSLSDGDILLIDEIHRVNKQIEEILYPAMEDFAVDIVTGEGLNAKAIRIPLPQFTLIGATTKAGSLTAPLRDRFGSVNRMEFYTVEELSSIVKRSANVLGVSIDDSSATEIAKRSRGTPRLANRLLRQVRNFAQVNYAGQITPSNTDQILSLLGIDKNGLDDNDQRYLRAIKVIGDGSPVGLSTIASAIGEDELTITDVYEPFLLQNGLVNKTPKGRVLSEKGLGCLSY